MLFVRNLFVHLHVFKFTMKNIRFFALEKVLRSSLQIQQCRYQFIVLKDWMGKRKDAIIVGMTIQWIEKWHLTFAKNVIARTIQWISSINLVFFKFLTAKRVPFQIRFLSDAYELVDESKANADPAMDVTNRGFKLHYVMSASNC